MGLRAFALGLVLGFLVAAAPSCLSNSCNSTTCRGCCLKGLCLNPGRPEACGARGVACAPCAAGETCRSNQCIAGGVGASCTTALECGGIGDSSAQCKLATNPFGDPYRDGYCTRPCSAQSDCPGGSYCLGVWRPYGEYDVACWQGCQSPSDCRAGYECWGILGLSASVCWLSPLPSPDPGPPAPPGLIGSPCSVDGQCQNPPDDGFCLAEQVDGGPSGHTGGECGAPCDVGRAPHCGDGGVCVTSQTTLGPASFCSRACVNPNQGQGDPEDGGCRQSYVCASLTTSDGGVAPIGRCTPNCNNPGAGCRTGTCGSSGYCQ